MLSGEQLSRPLEGLRRKSRTLKDLADDILRLSLDALEVVGALEALGVDLVDRLGSRWPGGKPTMHYAITFFGEPGAEIVYPIQVFLFMNQ